MIGPAMFEAFCWEDNWECCQHVDVSLYHLDGLGAVRHVPMLLRLAKLNCIQRIQGAGQPLPSQWLGLLRQIQAGGKSLQLYDGGAHGGDADLKRELNLLGAVLDPNRRFFWVVMDSGAAADDLVVYTRRLFGGAK